LSNLILKAMGLNVIAFFIISAFFLVVILVAMLRTGKHHTKKKKLTKTTDLGKLPPKRGRSRRVR